MSNATGKPVHSLTLLLQEIASDGMDMDWIVTPEQLGLPPEDGRIPNDFHWVGHVAKSPTSESEAYFQGTLFGTVVRECVRCLQEFQDPMAISIHGTFQVEHKKRQASSRRGRLNEPMTLDDLEDDIYWCEGHRLAFAPIFREHLILATPLQPLCAPECLGLCENCGQNLNRQRCACAEHRSSFSHFTKLQELARQLDKEQKRSDSQSKIVSH